MQNFLCRNGMCAPSMNGCGALRACDEGCVDVQTSPLHCGACGNDCQQNEVCDEGQCRGFAPATACVSCPCVTCASPSSCCPAPSGVIPLCVSAQRCPAM
jgi:hypothetical protein